MSTSAMGRRFRARATTGHTAVLPTEIPICPEASGPGDGPGEEAPIREPDRVRLLVAVTDNDDTRIPMGATGTVVAVHGNGEAVEVGGHAG